MRPGGTCHTTRRSHKWVEGTTWLGYRPGTPRSRRNDWGQRVGYPDVIALVLSDGFRPGSRSLTRRLALLIDLEPGERVLDVARGHDGTALFLASEFGVRVDGVDVSKVAARTGSAKAAQQGIAARVRFYRADGDRLSVPDSSVDAFVSEREVFAFPDRPLPASEIARVLRPGGRAGLTEVTVDPERWNADRDSFVGSLSRIAYARPLADYRGELEGAGLQVTRTERHDDYLATLIKVIDARLTFLSLKRAPALSRRDLDAVRDRLSMVGAAIRTGVIGYSLLIARKADSAT